LIYDLLMAFNCFVAASKYILLLEQKDIHSHNNLNNEANGYIFSTLIISSAKVLLVN